MQPVIRVARPTNDLGQIQRFYGDGLGLDLLASFQNHSGFDGMIFGRRGLPYHFEFTCEQGRPVAGAPSLENIIVFYLPHASQWQASVDRMAMHSFLSVPSHNPYWDNGGRTFEDFEGYRVVLFNRAWMNP